MYRGELKDEFLEAALLGAHGSATSIMLAIGSEELASAATAGDGDGRVLANFWYLPGNFTAAIAAADAVSLEGGPMLDDIARLAVVYRVDNGEVLFRLACERRVFDALGEEWAGLSLARRNAWLVFGTVANRVYDVLLEADREGAQVVPIRGPAFLAETIWDEDKEGSIDPVRAAAVQMMAAPEPELKPAKSRGKKAAPADAVALSITSPAEIDLPPETESQPENDSD
ncbi:hypothetical protein MKI84_12955 [Ancylobacter sp. A5.8]|uniref:hypothetical protein n=1 Tax=Ancylobacter gelatini TaxID=2919920 RepID=UPI001F4EF968|nr:hypothetical protein [Ancylobacter gelatini]MCJ8143826.1 hypothetical protein [Ancylobacter gelatini]